MNRETIAHFHTQTVEHRRNIRRSKEQFYGKWTWSAEEAPWPNFRADVDEILLERKRADERALGL